jgi:hypothetical protein
LIEHRKSQLTDTYGFGCGFDGHPFFSRTLPARLGAWEGQPERSHFLAVSNQQ